MKKLYSFIILVFSLLIVSCNGYVPVVSNNKNFGTVNSSDKFKSNKLTNINNFTPPIDVYGKITSKNNTNNSSNLKFSINYSCSLSKKGNLKTNALECENIAFYKIFITGIGIDSPIYPSGVDSDNMIAVTTRTCTTDSSVTIPNVPYGKARIATIIAYNIEKNEIPGTTIKSVFDVTSDTTNVEISYRTTPSAVIVENIINQPNPFLLLASRINLDDLNTFIDNITGVGSMFPDYTYTTHPTLVNTDSITNDLLTNGGNVSILSPTNPDYKILAGSIRGNITGLLSGDKASINTLDPVSQPLSDVSENTTFNINNVTPGTWEVIASAPGYKTENPLAIVNSGGTVDVGTINFIPFWGQTQGPGGGTKINVIRFYSTGIYVGTNKGLFKSTDWGDTWNPINNGLINMEILSFIIDSTNNLYVGTNGNGIFKSTNGGTSWSQVNTGLTNLSIQTLNIDSSNNIYAGTKSGLFKSTNGGSTWTNISTGNTPIPLIHSDIRSIEISSTGYIYAATSGGVYRTTDSGDTWSNVSASMDPLTTDIRCLKMINDDTMYAGTVNGVFKTINASDTCTWNHVSTGMNTSAERNIRYLISNPSDSNIIYAATEVGVFKTTDANNTCTWSLHNTGLTNPDCYTLDAANPNTVFVGTYSGVFNTTDGANNWANTNNGIPFQIVTYLTVDPSNLSNIYATTDGGGVFNTTNNGGSWAPISNGITNLHTSCISVAPSNPSIMYVGTYGGGVFKTTDGGINWNEAIGLTNTNISSIIVDRLDSNKVYVSTYDNGVFKTTNGGTNWESVNSGLPSSGYIHTIKLHPTSNDTIYAGTNDGVYKTTDGGTNWSKMSSLFDNSNIKSIAIDPVDPNIIYVGQAEPPNIGAIYKTTNEGTNWKIVYIGGSVYSIAIDEVNSNNIFAGTDGNLLYSKDGGTNWEQINTGLTNTNIRSVLTVNTTPFTIFVGTYGNSVFKSNY